MKKLIVILIIASLAACEKEMGEADTLGDNAGILGTWVESGYADDVLQLNRQGELDPDRYGFSIHDDGTFVERKNSSFCGTPPISYGDYQGTWEAVSDSLLEITVGYWGGIMTYQIRIVSLSGDDLAVRFLYAQDRATSR